MVVGTTLELRHASLSRKARQSLQPWAAPHRLRNRVAMRVALIRSAPHQRECLATFSASARECDDSRDEAGSVRCLLEMFGEGGYFRPRRQHSSLAAALPCLRAGDCPALLGGGTH